MNSKQVVLVLGCHRSGTSALTGSLSMLGCGLPKRVLLPSPSNPKGHFEPHLIGSLQEDLLNEIASSWDDPAEVSPFWFETEECQEYVNRLIELVREEFAETTLPLLKEPRICRLLPMWKMICANLNMQPLVIHIYRRPIEVAESLKARNKLSLQKGILIWLRNQLEAEFHTRDCVRTFLTFDELLKDWRGTLKRVETELQITFPNQQGFHENSIELFLEQGLKHHDHLNSSESHLLEFANKVHHGFDRLRARTMESFTFKEFDKKRAGLEFLELECKQFAKYETLTEDLKKTEERLVSSNLLLESQSRSAINEIAHALSEITHAVGEIKAVQAENQQMLRGLMHQLEHVRQMCDYQVALPSSFEQFVYERIPEIVRRSLKERKLLADIRYLAKSNLFDPEWYYQHNADVFLAGVDAATHYVRYGEEEGRQPNPNFKVDRQKLAYYRQLAFTGCYFVAYLKEHVRFNLLGDAKPHNQVSDTAETLPSPSNTRSVPERDPAIDAKLIESLNFKPEFSILVPVYNQTPEFLRALFSSVEKQVYQKYKIIFVDDGSKNPQTRTYLDALRHAHKGRVEAIFSGRNRGMSAATNIALFLSESDFVCLLDHDDELAPDALLTVAQYINKFPDADVFYSDEDKIAENGCLEEPFLKPDWSPEFLRGVMYVGHLLTVRRKLLVDCGGFDSKFDKVQDFELMLRLSERTRNIIHIPKVLYHWRRSPGSLAAGTEEKSGIDALQKSAVEAHLQRVGCEAVVENHPKYRHRLLLKPPASYVAPQVSIVIPTKDQPEHLRRCLESIFTNSTHRAFEVILVDTGTTDAEALALFQRFPVKVIQDRDRFNFSRAINLGVEAASGQNVLLLNNDTELIDPDWLQTLSFFLDQPGVGAVGPLLLYSNNTVQHAGVVLGFRGTADHVMRHFPEDCEGYFGSMACTREVTGITGAALLTPRSVFEELGGLDEGYEAHYQDVDFCLQLRKLGYRLLLVPYVKMYHHESVSRGAKYSTQDRLKFIERWKDELAKGDPYYNPQFDLDDHTVFYKIRGQ